MIIEDICSNPYNNSGDRKIMKKYANQVKKDGSQTELKKQMQALTLKIKTLMRAQAQVFHYHTSIPNLWQCGIVHGLGECIIDDKLAADMDETNFVRGGNNSYH